MDMCLSPEAFSLFLAVTGLEVVSSNGYYTVLSDLPAVYQWTGVCFNLITGGID